MVLVFLRECKNTIFLRDMQITDSQIAIRTTVPCVKKIFGSETFRWKNFAERRVIANFASTKHCMLWKVRNMS